MRQQIAAANWKMNLTIQQAETLLEEILKTTHTLKDSQLVVFAVPFPYLVQANEIIHNRKNMFIAAQNCYSVKSGAYTGEVSAEMLQSIGIKYVVLGHSEKRQYFSESNQMLGDKVKVALEFGLRPIFCCGEPLPVREAGNQNAFVEQQLKESLFDLAAEQIQEIVIAYEPIWAIGTGRTASSEQAQEMHAHLRKLLENRYGAVVADNLPILYGGSVKGNNAKDLFSQPDVDGGLVGGASLIASEFNQIIDALK